MTQVYYQLVGKLADIPEDIQFDQNKDIISPYEHLAIAPVPPFLESESDLKAGSNRHDSLFIMGRRGPFYIMSLFQSVYPLLLMWIMMVGSTYIEDFSQVAQLVGFIFLIIMSLMFFVIILSILPSTIYTYAIITNVINILNAK